MLMNPSVSIQFQHPDRPSDYLALRINLDQKEIIREAEFEGHGLVFYQKCLEVLVEMIRDLPLSEAQNLTEENFFEFYRSQNAFVGPSIKEIISQREKGQFPFYFLPLFLLKAALKKYSGATPSYAEMMERKEEELLCRCFGVYEKDIQKAVLAEPSLSFSSLQKILKVSVGCMNCLDEVKKYFNSLQVRQESSSSGPILTSLPFLGELSPVEVVLRAQPLLNQWVKNHYPQNGSFKITIMKIAANKIWFRLVNQPPEFNEREDLKEIEILLSTALEETVHLLHFK